MGATTSDPELINRLEGLLALGDPDGEVAFAYNVKEAVAQFYRTDNQEEAADLLREIDVYKRQLWVTTGASSTLADRK